MVGIPCRAQPDGKQQTPSEKTKMPRDGARVPRCSKKASPKRSTIKCVRHPGRTRTATNQSHNSRVLATCEAAARCLFLRAFTWPCLSRCLLTNPFGVRSGDGDDLVFDS